MLIVRFRTSPDSAASVGVLAGDRVRPLDGVDSLAALWHMPLDDLRTVVASPTGTGRPVDQVELLAPVDGRTEVWAAGVTYETSRQARIEESERAATVYELIYSAERPELFFKSVAWRVVGDGGTIGVRADSTVDVPEPEVALVINSGGEVVGYTICDDVSSRSIDRGRESAVSPAGQGVSWRLRVGAGHSPGLGGE